MTSWSFFALLLIVKSFGATPQTPHVRQQITSYLQWRLEEVGIEKVWLFSFRCFLVAERAVPLNDTIRSAKFM